MASQPLSLLEGGEPSACTQTSYKPESLMLEVVWDDVCLW